MATALSGLLTAWREAERRWEQRGPADDVRARALEVVAAWVTYQDAALLEDSNEVLLVADDEQVYVGVTRGVTRLLGYDVGDLIGTRVQDLAAPDLKETTPSRWAEFLAEAVRTGISGFERKMVDWWRSGSRLAPITRCRVFTCRGSGRATNARALAATGSSRFDQPPGLTS